MSSDGVLITGASGSLGQQLIHDMTKAGGRPIVMLREGSNSAYVDSFDLEKRLADLRNESQLAAAVQGVDAVIHTAAWVNFRQDKLTQFTGVNTFGAINLYKAARKAGVKRFVQVSSVAAVGGRPRAESAEQHPITEEFAFNLEHLRVPYIMTKRAAEVELLKLYREGGPELVIVNPSIMVAPSRSGDDRKKARERFRYRVLPRLCNHVNLVDVRDVAPTIIAAMERGRAGERYILAGENIAVSELVKRVSSVLGISLVQAPIPQCALMLSARMAVIVHRFKGTSKVSYYPDLVKMLEYDWAFSSEKAVKGLGFRSRPLQETLADLLHNRFNGTWMKP